MNWLTISSMEDAAKRFARAGVTHAISFKDISCAYPMLPGISSKNRLLFDIPDHLFASRTAEHARAKQYMGQIIDWARALPEGVKIGVNCHFGMSRSTAAALVVAVAREGFERGTQTFWAACEWMPTPNMTFVEVADDLLGLEEKLVLFVENLATKYMAERIHGIAPAADLEENPGVDDDVDKLLREYGLDQDPS